MFVVQTLVAYQLVCYLHAGTAIIFPLCVRDNITSLAWASAGGLCSIIYTTIVVVWEALTIEPVSAAVGAAAAAAAAEAGPGEHIITYRAESEPLERYVSFAGVLGTAGIIVFSFVVQMQVRKLPFVPFHFYQLARGWTKEWQTHRAVERVGHQRDQLSRH